MLFVIDIGNTHTVAGLLQQDIIVKQWRITTNPGMTSDELCIHYHNLFDISGIDTEGIEGIIISSVVPQLEAAYFTCCKSLFSPKVSPEVINICSDNVAGLIEIKLNNPSEVGADRLVNGIAALQICRANTIVIDFGTAITFDCISAAREYLGGLILPGLHVSLNALSSKAAKLPQIDISIPPEKVIGTDTVSAMKSGVLNGYGAMIEGLIERVRKEMEASGYPDIEILATGGLAGVIEPFAPSISRIEPDLTLKGLAYIYRQLRKR